MLRKAAFCIIVLSECIAFCPMSNAPKYSTSYFNRGFSNFLSRTRTSKFKHRTMLTPPDPEISTESQEYKDAATKVGDASTAIAKSFQIFGESSIKIADSAKTVGESSNTIAKAIQSLCLLCIAKSLISAVPDLPKLAKCILIVIPPIAPFLSLFFTPVYDFFRNQVSFSPLFPTNSRCSPCPVIPRQAQKRNETGRVGRGAGARRKRTAPRAGARGAVKRVGAQI
jgi:hypothetical protein